MLTVRSLSGETELLTNIKDCEVYEEVNGDFNISFTSFLNAKNEHAYHLLQEESIIELEGHEFRVKTIEEIRNKKQVFAQHVFFDLIEHQLYGINGGTKNIDQVFSWLLSGTGWTFTNVNVSGYKLLANFGEDNAVKLIWAACSVFDCEIKIMPNKHLMIYQRIGNDTDNQFRYKHNIKTIRKTVDTTNLCTVIKGFGANGLEVTYTSPYADIYGYRHAEPIRDDRYTQSDSMLDRLKQELNDLPEISIELELSQLDFDVKLGDRIWLIYEPLNIDFKARISTYTYFPFTNKLPIVTIENKKKQFTDILTQQRVKIDESKKEYRSRFEQTNDRITMEVEAVNQSIATLEIRADSIVSTVEDYYNQSMSYIDQRADSIMSVVESYDDSISAIDQKANSISLSVSNLSSRVSSAESQITIQAGQISSKVEKNGVISAINQSAETIDIDASRINMKGITNVANTLYIGESFKDSSYKSIQFRGTSGAVGIGSTQDNMTIYALNSIVFDTYEVNFSRVQSIRGLTVSSADYATNAGSLGGRSASGYARCLTHQTPTIEFLSNGTLRVTHSNGNYSQFIPDYTTF